MVFLSLNYQKKKKKKKYLMTYNESDIEKNIKM